MKFKVIILTIASVGIGLLAGWLLFGGNSQETTVVTDSSINVQQEEEIWTCSMHPQIRQGEPGDCPICGMDLIILDKSSSSSDPLVFEMTEEAIKLSNIQTTVVGSPTKNGNELKLNGKVKADETQAASLVSHIPGRIEKLYVSFTGEPVYKGQKIATIYSPELITAQKELIEAKKIIDISPGLLNAAKNKLRYWKLSDTVIEEIANSEQIRENFDIYADHSGVVVKRNVSVGDYLRTGEVMFDIQNLNKLWILFDVYENDLSSVKIGNVIEFTTSSDPNKIYKAKITFIDPVINPNTRVATIRAEVINKNNQLKPEMFVRGTLKGAVSKSQIITVPKTAVMWTGKRSVVYVKMPNTQIPSFEYREVDLGSSIGKEYIISAGIEAGEEVVTNGAFVIDASAQLNNQTSMMNRNVMVPGTDHSEHLPDYTATTPDEFKQQLYGMVETYMVLKNALVQSDVDASKIAAGKFFQSLTKVDMSLVGGDAHLFWMEQNNALQTHSELVNKGDNLDEQRKQFNFLSAALIKTVKSFGIISDTLYVQHCPMAIDDNGADWLSLNDKIRNPYFGEQMLTCGTNQDTITKTYKNQPMEQVSNSPQKIHNH